MPEIYQNLSSSILIQISSSIFILKGSRKTLEFRYFVDLFVRFFLSIISQLVEIFYIDGALAVISIE